MKPEPGLVLPAKTYEAGKIYKDEDEGASSMLFITLPEDHSSEIIDCGVLFTDQHEIPNFYVNEQFRLQIRATGDIPFLDIWIPRMRPDYVHLDKSVRGVAELLFRGDLRNFDLVERIHHCIIYVQDNAFFGSFDPKNPISWTTPFGRARLNKVDPYGIPGQARCSIHIDLEYKKFSLWQDLLSNLSNYLDELMGLISFLCKQYVHWYKLSIYFFQQNVQAKTSSPTEVVGFREPVMVGFNPKIRKFGDYGVHPLQLLVNLKVLQLQPEVAEKIFTRYANKNWTSGEIIKRIISVLMVTHTNAILEQQLGIAYTSLEMLVSRFAKSKDKMFTDDQASKLESEIKMKVLSLPDTPQVLGLTPEKWAELLPDIEKKLLELQRRPYRAKLSHLFENLKNLLPPIMGRQNLTPEHLIHELLEDGGMVSRRNKFIHEGKIKSNDDGWGDVSLIRFFVSVWILDLLGYPLKDINPHDSDLWKIQEVLRKRSNKKQ